MQKPKTIQDITTDVKTVMSLYAAEYPEVQVDADYFPFKVSEEWGECLQAYLMYTSRGRQKNKTKAEIKEMLELELADVLGFLLLFADSQEVDLEKALEKKWFKRLPAE